MSIAMSRGTYLLYAHKSVLIKWVTNILYFDFCTDEIFYLGKLYKLVWMVRAHYHLLNIYISDSKY